MGFPGVVDRICEFISSADFHNNCIAPLKRRLDFGWATDAEVKQYQSLHQQFSATGKFVITPWAPKYLERVRSEQLITPWAQKYLERVRSCMAHINSDKCNLRMASFTAGQAGSNINTSQSCLAQLSDEDIATPLQGQSRTPIEKS